MPWGLGEVQVGRLLRLIKVEAIEGQELEEVD